MYRFALAILAAAAMALAGTASAQEDMPFALDWKFEGPSAPYFAAIDNGHFEAAGLNVEISAGQGSLDAIPKVATGAFPVGFADINSLVKFLDQNPGAPVIAVMMVYDKPPFAVVGRKSLGVMVPKDLEGRVLGAPPPDGAWAQFRPSPRPTTSMSTRSPSSPSASRPVSRCLQKVMWLPLRAIPSRPS